MIREIINYTRDLIEDIPDIMRWKNIPKRGLYVFIDIDEEGNWTNQDLKYGKDYTFADGKSEFFDLSDECKVYSEACSWLSMNKLGSFDVKKKILACSPFAFAYNFKFNSNDLEELNLKLSKGATEEQKRENESKIRQERRKVIEKCIPDYKKNALKIFRIDSRYDNIVDYFFAAVPLILDAVEKINEYNTLKDTDLLKVFLRSVPIGVQLSMHESYFKDNIFIGNQENGIGSVSFFTAFSAKKRFILHKTAALKKGVNYRFGVDDALILMNFEKLVSRKILPTMLPVVVDKRELNADIVKIINDTGERLGFRDIVEALFEKHHAKNYLQDFYLLNIINTKDGLVINDIDFVPQFRYALDNVTLHNVLESGYVKNNTFELDKDEKIDNIFDFERIVVRTLFNNSLVRIKDDSYSTNYFGEVEPKYVNGGDIVYQLISKYRYSIYDYIYKSNTHAIDKLMFDDITYQSILSNIKQDEIKTQRFSQNSIIKRKLNIWFSLDNLFTINNTIMASSINELKSKMIEVANGNGDLTSNAEFAFAAGQLVSYLIDRSAAGNKSYSMLEPYLQKVNSGSLQDAIAHSFTIYKHDISVYKGKFEHIASQVFTYDSSIDTKPILKYFLAGCFSDCVIYIKNEKN